MSWKSHTRNYSTIPAISGQARELEKGEDGVGGWVLQLTVAPLD